MPLRTSSFGNLATDRLDRCVVIRRPDNRPFSVILDGLLTSALLVAPSSVALGIGNRIETVSARRRTVCS